MKKKKILLVEDDMPTVDIYKTALEFSKFEVETAGLGKEAIEKIEKAKSKKPDLIILDLILPDMSGIEVLKKIRENKETKDTPVFMFTNYPNPEIGEKGYSFGLDEFILKTDYTPTEIVKLVKKKLKV